MNVDVDVRVVAPIAEDDTLAVEWTWENADDVVIIATGSEPLRLVVTVVPLGKP